MLGGGDVEGVELKCIIVGEAEGEGDSFAG
jgi:hypothetical protein